MTAIYAIVSESPEGKFFHSFHNTERCARLALDGLYEFGLTQIGCDYRIKKVSVYSKSDIDRWYSNRYSENVR